MLYVRHGVLRFSGSCLGRCESEIEVFPFAFGEVVEGVGAEAGAVEGFDVVALTGEHAANLVVAAFGEGEGG